MYSNTVTMFSSTQNRFKQEESASDSDVDDERWLDFIERGIMENPQAFIDVELEEMITEDWRNLPLLHVQEGINQAAKQQ